MLQVFVEDLKPNMILARPVTGTGGVVLLYEGAELDNASIEKLKENNIYDVYIKDRFDSRAEIYTLEAIEEDSLDTLREVMAKRIKSEENEDLNEINETALRIIDDVISNVDVSTCILNVKRKSNDIYAHMLNVASLATVIGIKIGFSEQQLKDVATGALLHDIGICDVTIPYYDVDISSLPAVDKLNYRRHVITGYELLQSYDNISEMAKMIVISHHERVDGSGYPFHKVKERIPEEVRLVSICDHFDEMINGIGYKNQKVYEVVEYFRTNESYLFDYDMMLKVISNIAWYPNGCIVRTSEDEIGRVVGQHKDLPDRPILEIFKNSDGEKIEPPITKDLTKLLTLFIVEILE